MTAQGPTFCGMNVCPVLNEGPKLPSRAAMARATLSRRIAALRKELKAQTRGRVRR